MRSTRMPRRAATARDGREFSIALQ